MHVRCIYTYVYIYERERERERERDTKSIDSNALDISMAMLCWVPQSEAFGVLRLGLKSGF